MSLKRKEKLAKKIQQNIITLIRGEGTLTANLPFREVSVIKIKLSLLLSFCAKLTDTLHQEGQEPLKHLVRGFFLKRAL